VYYTPLFASVKGKVLNYLLTKYQENLAKQGKNLSFKYMATLANVYKIIQ